MKITPEKIGIRDRNGNEIPAVNRHTGALTRGLILCVFPVVR
jgi:hypothetical protein